MDAVELLEQVTDRVSFIKFVEALIEDREEATKLEKENPSYWRYGAPNGWQNSSIEHFLGAALAYFDVEDEASKEPSWRAFAEFLYMGKIYE